MKDYERIFDWVVFDEGRARFAGGIRGVDECGHQTFAVEINAKTHYGEIKKTFLPDKHNYNTEILSFGYWDIGDVGRTLEEAISRTFSPSELEIIKRLIVNLVSEVSAWDLKPSVMSESEKSRFMGKVTFREGWALIHKNEHEVAA